MRLVGGTQWRFVREWCRQRRSILGLHLEVRPQIPHQTLVRCHAHFDGIICLSHYLETAITNKTYLNLGLTSGTQPPKTSVVASTVAWPFWGTSCRTPSCTMSAHPLNASSICMPPVLSSDKCVVILTERCALLMSLRNAPWSLTPQ